MPAGLLQCEEQGRHKADGGAGCPRGDPQRRLQVRDGGQHARVQGIRKRAQSDEGVQRRVEV